MAIDRILRAVQSEVWAIQPEKLEQIAQILESKFRTGEIARASEIEAAENAQRRSARPTGSVMVIPLLGTIARRMSALEASSGGQSLDMFAETFRAAVANDQVDSILLDIHSPGGSVYGVEEAARMIAEGAKQKRVVAIADQLMASAAYYLGAAAGELVVTPSGEVGSIGVYTVHFDYSEQARDLGIKVTIIKAGAKKAEGNPFEALADDARDHTQSIVDAFYNQFVRSVAKGRGVGVDVVRSETFGQGRTFDSARAVQRGMADRVATMEETIADMQRGKRWPNADGRAAVTVPADIVAAGESPLDSIGPFVQRAAQLLDPPAFRAIGSGIDALTTGQIDAILAAHGEPVVQADLLSHEELVTAGGQAAPDETNAPNPPALKAKEQPMEPVSAAAQPSGAGSPSADEVRAAEKRRAHAIRKIGMEHGIDAAQVDRWIADDRTVDQVNAETLEIVRQRTAASPVVRVGTEREATRSFSRLGEQLHAIMQVGKAGGSIDPRLHGIHAAATGAGEAVPSDGGFLLAPEFTGEILTRVYEMGQVASRVLRRPIGAKKNGIKLNAIDESSRVTGSRYGGIQSYWVGEGDTVTASKPKFRQMELTLKKLMSLFYATDELLEDEVALAGFAEQAFAEEVVFMVENAVFRGTGAGQPLGFLNSGALVTVSKESGQAADTVVSANCTKMLSRLWARSRAGAAWFVTQDVEAQLPLMTVGQMPVYIPPGGLKDNPYGTLLGRPVIPVEYGSAIGDVGDICLADLGQYLMIDKNAAQQAWSIHVRFLNDEQVFRITYRCDGQPTWNNALTPFLGSSTVSPFVTLEAR